MNQSRTLRRVAFMSFVAIIVLACTGGGLITTATSLPTNLPTPADTATARPTSTSTLLPAATEIPSTPTPAPVGEAVRSESFEVTVVSARELNRVYMGNYYYYPKADQIFVEMVVKVSNLTGSEVSIPWENVYVIEESGDTWYPTWGGYKAVKTGRTVDGSTIGVDEIVDGKATLVFEEDAFLRTIWFLTRDDPTTILFGFDNSPYVEITID